MPGSQCPAPRWAPMTVQAGARVCRTHAAWPMQTGLRQRPELTDPHITYVMTKSEQVVGGIGAGQAFSFAAARHVG
eukprot:31481-Pyramimonas_sp.AAC.1